MKFLSKSVPVYLLIVAALAGAFVSYSFTTLIRQVEESKNEDIISKPQPEIFANSCSVDINRLAGRKFIRPLLFAEKTCEADRLMAVKTALHNVVANLKTNGQIDEASVYVRLFQKGDWFSLNEQAKFQPGSLFKVPVLITWLRMNENKPGVLNLKLTYNKMTEESKGLKQEFVKKAIKLGNTYTVKELLEYMIEHSDNNATMLLLNNTPKVEFNKTFTDFSLSTTLTENNATISAKDYSLFWLALYNGSYLTFDDSEYALQLLSKSDFTEGLVKGIPEGVKIAHKFGEKGDSVAHGLHETGIVYVNNFPYLITIMTQGKDQAKLPKAIQDISAAVYKNIESFTH